MGLRSRYLLELLHKMGITYATSIFSLCVSIFANQKHRDLVCACGSSALLRCLRLRPSSPRWEHHHCWRCWLPLKVPSCHRECIAFAKIACRQVPRQIAIPLRRCDVMPLVAERLETQSEGMNPQHSYAAACGQIILFPGQTSVANPLDSRT